jgi:hypothetical protein
MARWLKDPFAISLILVAVVGGVIAWFQFRPIKQETPPYLGSRVKSLDKITINFQEDKTVLKKNNDQWLVETENNQPADQQLVKDLLAKLETLKPTELVSQNADNHSKYGVDQTQAIRLLAYQNGQKKLELLVGKAGPSFNNNYLRKHGEEKVYLSNVSLRSTLIPADTWVKSQENQEENSAK